MRENFTIAERYKSRDFVSFHFVFAVNYVRDKNALYGIYYNNDFCAIIKIFYDDHEALELFGFTNIGISSILTNSILNWQNIDNININFVHRSSCIIYII